MSDFAKDVWAALLWRTALGLFRLSQFVGLAHRPASFLARRSLMIRDRNEDWMKSA